MPIGELTRKAPRPLPLGIDSYEKVIEGGYWSVDKTLLIRDLIDAQPEVVLFCRPRRFGKTLNMTMLRAFFEKPVGDPAELPEGAESSTAHLFRGKAIWACGERYTRLQGRFPVVYLTLKDLHYGSFAEAMRAYAVLVARECDRHPELSGSESCDAADRAEFARLRAVAPEGVDLEDSLFLLTRMLHQHWGVAPIVIIDEYDALIQDGHERGYYDDAVRFVRSLFGAAFKGNPHLTVGILTGILRVAKESIFSGLNNVQVNTVLDEAYAPYFGFTIEEARGLLAEYGGEGHFDEMLDWYDGYRFGDVDMLNPWSALNYVQSGFTPLSFWVESSHNAIIGEVLEGATPEIEEGLSRLVQGESVFAPVNTSIIYPEIADNPNSVWSFLLVTGYLTARRSEPRGGRLRCELAIPNREVCAEFSDKVTERYVAGSRRRAFAESLADALFDADAAVLERSLNDLLLASASFYDTANEPFYHGLFFGLCAMAGGDYRLTSNREAGDGRYDIQMEPKLPARGLPGIIIEIKATKDAGADLETLARELALKQIRDRRYAEEMRTRGVGRVVCYGAAFRGKEAGVAMEVA